MYNRLQGILLSLMLVLGLLPAVGQPTGPTMQVSSGGRTFGFSTTSIDSITFTPAAAGSADDYPSLLRLIEQNRQDIARLQDALGGEHACIDRHSGRISNWVYGAGKYVGYRQPIASDAVLLRVEARLYMAGPSDVGSSAEFLVGTVDQRGWLLPRTMLQATVSSVEGGVATFTFSGSPSISAGEMIFIRTAPKQDDASLAVDGSGGDDGCPLYEFSSLSAEGRRRGDDLSLFRVHVRYMGTAFASRSALEEVSARLSALQRQLDEHAYLTDRVTGTRYRLEMRDGVLTPVPLGASRVLAIGHSFVNYPHSPSADWYLDDGENRAMAASVYANQWPLMVAGRLGATLTRKNAVDFERNFSTGYDFATHWAVTDDYDAICVFIGENVAYTDEFPASVEAAMAYLKAAAPHATVYWAGSWNYGPKYDAMCAAAAAQQVRFVDTPSTKGTDRQWHRGDYYLGRGGDYYPMGAAYSHPNDLGHAAIADMFLHAMGQDGTGDVVHAISFAGNAGTVLSTPSSRWPEGGIVTVRVAPGSEPSVTALSVTTADGTPVEAIRRTNSLYDGTERTYFTFVMPAGDVVVGTQ